MTRASHLTGVFAHTLWHCVYMCVLCAPLRIDSLLHTYIYKLLSEPLPLRRSAFRVRVHVRGALSDIYWKSLETRSPPLHACAMRASHSAWPIYNLCLLAEWWRTRARCSYGIFCVCMCATCAFRILPSTYRCAIFVFCRDYTDRASQSKHRAAKVCTRDESHLCTRALHQPTHSDREYGINNHHTAPVSHPIVRWRARINCTGRAHTNLWTTNLIKTLSPGASAVRGRLSRLTCLSARALNWRACVCVWLAGNRVRPRAGPCTKRGQIRNTKCTQPNTCVCLIESRGDHLRHKCT